MRSGVMGAIASDGAPAWAPYPCCCCRCRGRSSSSSRAAVTRSARLSFPRPPAWPRDMAPASPRQSPAAATELQLLRATCQRARRRAAQPPRHPQPTRSQTAAAACLAPQVDRATRQKRAGKGSASPTSPGASPRQAQRWSFTAPRPSCRRH
eukprot:scaffold2142_cov227-Prasinococcus_capsulatus_cf.AAC.2